jgi:murein DD-endopeptidase MepM/ murein hydrolase activator NlpD
VAAAAKLPTDFPGVAFGAWGNYVEIEHGGGLHTGYAHLSALEVAVGQQVTQSQRLGLSGETGLTYGAHLHFQCIQGRNRINPSPYLA